MTAAAGTQEGGTLLGGRVIYTQLNIGYRTGLEPVLLAASLPARAGERVVEAGTGAGAALLCLCARVQGVTALGLEQDAVLAALAAANARENGFAGMEVACRDVESWRADAPFDHAMANPPWHDPASTESPDQGRRAAKVASDGLVGRWASALGRGLRRRGSLTMILPAAHLAQGAGALVAAGCAEQSLMPLWPRAGVPAKLILLRGTKDGRGHCQVLPGLVLHETDGRFTEAAERILRGGAALPF